jgi:cytochrome oxidase Cu insertion factor (SCO1/SenC/PrrC family)
MKDRAPGLAVAALGIILVITAGWWALALAEMPQAPEWLLRTRDACFGNQLGGLPSAGGWILLIGEPVGLLGILIAIAGDELRAGLRALAGQAAGRLLIGLVIGSVLAGLGGAASRVISATADRNSPVLGESIAVDLAAPPLSLLDQFGHRRRLTDFRGRPVLVTFAFAHCEAVCPAVIRNVLAVRREAANAAVLIVTVDPWRDPPSRLPSIATQWGLGEDELVLGGTVGEVTATLVAWGIRADPDPRTGDVAHPATVRVIDPDGRIGAIVSGAGREPLRRSLALIRKDRRRTG